MLPVSAVDLIEKDTVEGERIEYKKTLNNVTIMSVVRTICAFANDLYNVNGGYVVIGVDEESGRPKHVVGIPSQSIDRWQKQLLEACRTAIQPTYLPRISVEKVRDVEVLVVTVRPGEDRPYRAKDKRDGKDRAVYIRNGSSTVKAHPAEERQINELAKWTPFDERANPDAHLSALDDGLLRSLRDALRPVADDVRFKRLDLYYIGPVAFGPLIGAVLARGKPVLVRHFQIDQGSDILAYQMDQRFLLGSDD